MPTQVKKKATKKAPAMTVEQYKAVLGDSAKQKIVIKLKPADLTGTLDQITGKIKRKVNTSEIVGEYTLTYKLPRSQYQYGRGYTQVGGPEIVGYRPLSDAEIETKGASLLAAKVKQDEKDARARAANVAKFNKLAEVLGYEAIADDSDA